MSQIKPPSSAKARDAVSIDSPAEGGGAASRLSSIKINDLSKVRETRWRPGLADQPRHTEIFASANDASGAGLALALASDALRMCFINKPPLNETEDRRQILWIQDKRAVQRGGRPYIHGLPAELRDRLIYAEAGTPEDALFALEEGLKCRDLACVIGEIAGNPRALDFTASRRLSLTAEKHGVALWLVRLEAEADLSSARMRWRVKSAPSSAPLWNQEAPGAPQWRAELFRARSHVPGQWTLSNDNQRLSICQHPRPANTDTAGPPDIGHLVRPTVGRSLAAVARA